MLATVRGGHFPVRFGSGSEPNQNQLVRFGLVWFGSHIFIDFIVLTKSYYILQFLPNFTAFYNFPLHFTGYKFTTRKIKHNKSTIHNQQLQLYNYLHINILSFSQYTITQLFYLYNSTLPATDIHNHQHLHKFNPT